MKDMALKQNLRTAIREKAKPARFDHQYRPHLGLTDPQQVAGSLHAVAVKRATLSLKLHGDLLESFPTGRGKHRRRGIGASSVPGMRGSKGVSQPVNFVEKASSQRENRQIPNTKPRQLRLR
jgi:hypothetical protein